MDVAQFGIMAFGVTAMFLVARKNKWGFILGILAQPFWLWTSITHRQWGIAGMSLLYAANWVYGAVKWFREDTAGK